MASDRAAPTREERGARCRATALARCKHWNGALGPKPCAIGVDLVKAVGPGERLITVDGLRIAHRGLPPFRARSANDHADDWPAWFVVGTDRVNWMCFPDRPGAVFTDRATAEAAAAALNAMAGAA